MSGGKAQVLFVDDEPEVLSGIRTSLRRERTRWDLRFAGSGEEALALISADPPDVVVTDMRMPGMDGAALLRRVHDEHPSVVRIVLSGEASAEQAMRSLPHVHRWLPKPCDRDELVGTIESALGTDRSVRVDELVGGVVSLPSPPALYTSLLTELEDPDASFGSVAALIEADPAITAKVLQWGSSPLLGWGHLDRVSDVLRAVGLASVAQLVLSAEVLDLMTEDRQVPGCDPEAMRRHAELTGQLAAAMVARSDQALARTAGLLHSVGTLVVTTTARDRLQTAMDTARLGRRPLAEIEETVLGVTLPEVGARLLTLWGLPLDISRIVGGYRHAEIGEATWMDVEAAVRVGAWTAARLLVARGELDAVLVEPAPDLPEHGPWRERIAAAMAEVGVEDPASELDDVAVAS